jgi:hypothetical protein
MLRAKNPGERRTVDWQALKLGTDVCRNVARSGATPSTIAVPGYRVTRLCNICNHDNLFGRGSGTTKHDLPDGVSATRTRSRSLTC